MSKFEKNEKAIAEAENVLISGGKYVHTDYEENQTLHLEIHEKEGGDSMLMKRHIDQHMGIIKTKAKMEMHIESSMPCEVG